MQGFFVVLLWVLCVAVFLYRGNRNFNMLNGIGVQVFETYAQLVFFRCVGAALVLLQVVFFLAALMTTANWLYSFVRYG